MTAISPGQGTGPILHTAPTVPLESLARHRPDTAGPIAPPTWFLIAMTALAFINGVAAWVCHSLPMMLLALLYAVIAFAADVYAAVRYRRAGAES